MTRVIHIIGTMNRGGVETWLMQLMRARLPGLEQHFLALSGREGAFDEEIRALGGRVLHLGAKPRELTFMPRLVKLFRGYDIVHSHVFQFSGAVLLAARLAGVKVRIAHAHTGGMSSDDQPLTRRVYERTMRQLIKRLSTHGLANSETSARSLFGEAWSKDSRFRVVLYGFDFSRFGELESRAHYKKKLLELDASRLVVGHVGRFHPGKNHGHLVQVFAHVLKDIEDAVLVLVGGGEEEQTIRAKVDELGIADNVRFVGIQSDVAPWLGAMNLMIFPSHFEGLGIVVLEAMAAGVPTLASQVIPTEVDVVPELIKRLPLSESAESWALVATAWMRQPEARFGRAECAARLQSSALGIETCIESLLEIYQLNRSEIV